MAARCWQLGDVLGDPVEPTPEDTPLQGSTSTRAARALFALAGRARRGRMGVGYALPSA
jgi:hypothetical protein